MKGRLAIFAAVWCGMAFGSAVAGEKGSASGPSPSLPDDYSCKVCHWKDGELWNQETPTVSESELADDIHWQVGLRCHDCHGGAPSIEDYENHRTDESFHAIASPADIPGFCGRCHSKIEYMRRYTPSARTDQETEYWTSGHGQRLKESLEEKKVDKDVATCVDCHGRHGILAVNDPRSPVYPTHVGETCARCHSDEKRMAGRTYHGRPLGHDQYEQWQQSVHGQALLKKGDLSAPTCNDCHGNHGAVPPGIDSVANACGSCHAKQAELFSEARMKHRFEEIGLPGCVTCHGNHRIVQPTDEMLGMAKSAVCSRCHSPENEQYGAPLAGGEAAAAMRKAMEDLKQQIAEAQAKLAEADRLGMEVSGPRYDLRQAVDALTNARSLIHSFSLDRVQKALKEGLDVATNVNKRAEDALREHTYRRIWLAVSLVPILLVVTLLILYIRTLPIPEPTSPHEADR
ncbi:MAG: hypothetical protein GXP27_06475 [Planctomycetes bacterium]|nr:hypothetical protein [Planctomycetota bacterium]